MQNSLQTLCVLNHSRTLTYLEDKYSDPDVQELVNFVSLHPRFLKQYISSTTEEDIDGVLILCEKS